MRQDAVPRFSEVYEAYHGKVLAYVRRLLGPEDAEDLTQEVFVKVDRSLATLADPSKLTSWIHAIALNAVRDAARRRSARPDQTASGPASGAEEGEPDDPLSRVPDGRSRSPEEQAIRAEMVACYLDFVRELPRRYYQVYVLSELEQLTNEEIARRLSVSVGTVKIRLHRARTRLHEALRRSCECYQNERGDLMGTLRDGSPLPGEAASGNGGEAADPPPRRGGRRRRCLAMVRSSARWPGR